MEVKSFKDAKENDVYLGEVNIRYQQYPDCEDENPDHQSLELSTVVGENYLVMQTHRWAADDIDGIIDVLQDFKKRALL